MIKIKTTNKRKKKKLANKQESEEIIQMNEVNRLRIPHIVVTPDREYDDIPSVKITFEPVGIGAEGDEEEENEGPLRRLRPNSHRCKNMCRNI